jgi:large subunit ribosomal protein L24e
MVIKRQCSFCAGEIEPGTGLLFVKRDGSTFHFCSGSCRKQQLVLGRVGHRVRWTRAHALKREQSTASGAAGGRPKAGRGPAPKAPAPQPTASPAARPATAETPAAASAAKPAVSAESPPAAPAKSPKPKAAKPKT